MQLLEIVQVARRHANEVVAGARHQVAGEHVGTVRQRPLEGAQRLVVLAVEGDLDKGGDAEPDRFRIDHGAIAGDHAVGFQRLQAARAGRWRQAHPRGQLHRRHAAVTGERRDDLAVETVDLHEFTSHGVIVQVYVRNTRFRKRECTENAKLSQYITWIDPF